MPADERTERNKAIEVAVGQIEKQFGKGAIMRLGQKGAIAPVDSIPTGSVSLDFALGIGGVPRGRVHEVARVAHVARPHRPDQPRQDVGGAAIRHQPDPREGLQEEFAGVVGAQIQRVLEARPHAKAADGSRGRGRPGMHFLRQLLVQRRGGGSVCHVEFFYRFCGLGDSEVGCDRRRIKSEPLADPDSLSYGFINRGSPA